MAALLEQDGIFVIFGSHRARDNSLRLLGLKDITGYYSWQRSNEKGVYLLTKEQVETLKNSRIKGWRRLRGPFDDLCKCWSV